MELKNENNEIVFSFDGNEKETIEAALQKGMNLNRIYHYGLNLTGAKAQGIELIQAVLPHCNQSKSDFSKDGNGKSSSFTGSIMPWIKARDTNWNNIIAKGTVFFDGRFSELRANGTILNESHWDLSRLIDCQMKNVKARKTTWVGSSLENVQIIGELNESEWAFSELKDVTLGGDLTGARFNNAFVDALTIEPGTVLDKSSFIGIRTSKRGIIGLAAADITPMHIFYEQEGPQRLFFAVADDEDDHEIEVGKEYKAEKGEEYLVGTRSHFAFSGHDRLYAIEFNAPTDIEDIPLGSCDHLYVKRFVVI